MANELWKDTVKLWLAPGADFRSVMTTAAALMNKGPLSPEGRGAKPVNKNNLTVHYCKEIWDESVADTMTFPREPDTPGGDRNQTLTDAQFRKDAQAVCNVMEKTALAACIRCGKEARAQTSCITRLRHGGSGSYPRKRRARAKSWFVSIRTSPGRRSM